MSKATFIVVIIAIGYFVQHSQAHSIHDYSDLDVAASDKEEEWKKGEEADFHEEDHEKHGKKGEKGYEEKHGYVFNKFSIGFLHIYMISLISMHIWLFVSM